MSTPLFDHERAAAMLGKHVLIGLEIHDQQDSHIEDVQFHGDIIRVSEEEGVVVRLVPSGMEYRMPAVFSAYEVAAPGDYRLASTGEIISNPDLMTSWVVYEPPEDAWDEPV